MAHWEDHEDIGHHADHDRWHAAQHVRKKPDPHADRMIPVFGKINPRHDADGEPGERSDDKEYPRPRKRVRHSSARFSHGLRHLNEEIEIDCADPLGHRVEEDEEEREDYQESAEHGERGHERARDLPPPVMLRGLVPHAANFFATLQTMSRAMAFSTTVTTKRRSAISMRELTYSGLVASENSLAMTLAIECEGLKREADISARFPITIVTAMVSPTALPSPSRDRK